MLRKGFCSQKRNRNIETLSGFWLGSVLEANGVAVNGLRTCGGMMNQIRESQKGGRGTGSVSPLHSGVQITGVESSKAHCK